MGQGLLPTLRPGPLVGEIAVLWALSQITENRKVWTRKSLIFQYTIFGFCLEKAILRQSLTGYYTYPNGHGPFPGIVLITAIWGTDEEMQELADAWAADGFVVTRRRGALWGLCLYHDAARQRSVYGYS